MNLQPVHTSTVKAQLRRGHPFDGYIAPEMVPGWEVEDGVGGAEPLHVSTEEELRARIADFWRLRCTTTKYGLRPRLWEQAPPDPTEE